jgi:hypothetical protein
MHFASAIAAAILFSGAIDAKNPRQARRFSGQSEDSPRPRLGVKRGQTFRIPADTDTSPHHKQHDSIPGSRSSASKTPRSISQSGSHQHKIPFVFDESVLSAADAESKTIRTSARPATSLENPAYPDNPLCPNGIRVRREFRDLPDDEWDDYKAALRKMYEPDETGRSKIDRFTKIHLDNASNAHNTAHFLPWHRWFTFLFEEELRKINPKLTVPYWVPRE